MVFLCRLALIAIDRPNERSLHIQPVLRIGGLAIILGVVSAFATQERHLVWLSMPSTLLLSIPFIK